MIFMRTPTTTTTTTTTHTVTCCRTPTMKLRGGKKTSDDSIKNKSKSKKRNRLSSITERGAVATRTRSSRSNNDHNTRNKKKRSNIDEVIVSSSSSSSSTITYSSSSKWKKTPISILIQLLSYLNNDELMAMCLVCKEIKDVIWNGNNNGMENKLVRIFELRSALPGNREWTIRFLIDMIRHFSNNNKTRILQRFQHIQVVDRNSDFAYINHNNDSVLETLMGISGYDDLLLEQLTQQTQMIGAVSLDMSRLHVGLRYNYDEMDLAKALPRALSFMVPNLRRLDISHTEMSETILEEFAIRCPYLEIVKRNNIMNFCNICANGYELRMMNNLKEIYFDNCAFHFDHGIKNEDRNDVDEYNVGDDFEITQFAAMQDLEKFSDLFLFHKLLNKPLERVSSIRLAMVLGSLLTC